MHYFEFGKRDTTIYSGGTTSSINTGLDEILEINKVVQQSGTIGNVSRILIDFDLSYISESVQSGLMPSTTKYYLNLFDATSEEVEAEQPLHIYMVSGSWKQGTGKLDHNPVTDDGASFQYRDHEAKTPWVTGSVLTDGGTWFTSSYASGQEYNISSSYNLTFDDKDVRADVTDLVNNWIHSSSIYPNNGFIVKREDSGSYGEHPSSSMFNFSSGQEGDSIWSTGSLSAITATDLERQKVYFKNLRPEYKEKSKVKLRVVGRELYPTTAFATTPAELDVKYLPSASAFYQVKDADTEEEIIPFGTGSKISCDSTGNFFNIQMDGLQAERNYRFCFKVVSGSGNDEQINYYDDEYEFRVVR